jgi:hypothetical protein
MSVVVIASAISPVVILAAIVVAPGMVAGLSVMRPTAPTFAAVLTLFVTVARFPAFALLSAGGGRHTKRNYGGGNQQKFLYHVTLQYISLQQSTLDSLHVRTSCGTRCFLFRALGALSFAGAFLARAAQVLDA